MRQKSRSKWLEILPRGEAVGEPLSEGASSWGQHHHPSFTKSRNLLRPGPKRFLRIPKGRKKRSPGVPRKRTGADRKPAPPNPQAIKRAPLPPSSGGPWRDERDNTRKGSFRRRSGPERTASKLLTEIVPKPLPIPARKRRHPQGERFCHGWNPSRKSLRKRGRPSFPIPPESPHAPLVSCGVPRDIPPRRRPPFRRDPGSRSRLR